MSQHPVYDAFIQLTKLRASHLCVGLDAHMSLMPDTSLSGIESYLSAAIEATADLCVAYKPNLAFFEGLGLPGLEMLIRLRSRAPRAVPWIIDAKRGDIGTTSHMQARFLFDHLGADATTLHPYMGLDSVSPFFEYSDKYHFVLALTSNPSASDFELLTLEDGVQLCEKVLRSAATWNATYGNVGVVVGATRPEHLAWLRQIDSNLLYLVPGVGAQGGTFSDAAAHSQNQDGLCIVNVSRGVLYGPGTGDLVKDIRTRALGYLTPTV